MLPLLMNSFFSESGCAKVAVYWSASATATVVASSTAPAIQRKFLTCPPLSHTYNDFFAKVDPIMSNCSH
jgi:hypothetical protein